MRSERFVEEAFFDPLQPETWEEWQSDVEVPADSCSDTASCLYCGTCGRVYVCPHP